MVNLASPLPTMAKSLSRSQPNGMDSVALRVPPYLSPAMPTFCEIWGFPYDFPSLEVALGATDITSVSPALETTPLSHQLAAFPTANFYPLGSIRVSHGESCVFLSSHCRSILCRCGREEFVFAWPEVEDWLRKAFPVPSQITLAL